MEEGRMRTWQTGRWYALIGSRDGTRLSINFECCLLNNRPTNVTIFIACIYLLCVCIYVWHMHARICGDRIQPAGVCSLLLYVKPGVVASRCLWVFINGVSARDRTYIFRLWCKWIHPLSHVAGPTTSQLKRKQLRHFKSYFAFGIQDVPSLLAT